MLESQVTTSSKSDVTFSPEISPFSRYEDGATILDSASVGMQSGDVAGALFRLNISLLEYRAELGPDLWSDFARRFFPAHTFREMVHQSPFSRRSYAQPRGYAGDAVTLDYIYGDLYPARMTDLGRRIYEWEIAAPSSASVRGRRDLLARYIDETFEAAESPAILSIACGHLRELSLTEAWKKDRVRNFTALDQDLESLAVVREQYEDHGVTAFPGSVRGLIAGKHKFEDLDLVYAAGLYDYLPLRAAQRLTAIMFRMLKSGGRLLVANFQPSLVDIASMETTMNWWLIYRTEQEMAELPGEIERSQVREMKIFPDYGGNLAYLEITRD